jgi:excisionase family DNA binding protein
LPPGDQVQCAICQSPPNDLELLRVDLRELTAAIRLGAELPAGDDGTVSVAQACKLLGCGKSRIYELLAKEELEAAPKVGRERRLQLKSVRALQNQVSGAPAARRERGRRQRTASVSSGRLAGVRVR